MASVEAKEISRGLSAIGELLAAARRAGIDPDPLLLEQRAALRARNASLRNQRRGRRKMLRKLQRTEKSPKVKRGPKAATVKVTRTVLYQYDPADDHRLEQFYASREWKLMRYEALRKHGGRCQCCGDSPTEGKRLNVDHIFPARVYWDLRLDINNLQVLCADCNEGKGARHADDWRPEEAT